MLIEDKKGNQLLELTSACEADLGHIAMLTHALVVARHGDRALLVFNRHRQYWELAGGMLDPGETPRACAVRELYEESGVACAPDALTFVGLMKFLLQPTAFNPQSRIEYGALYSADAVPLQPFAPNEEISQICWWDGSATIGEISIIDRKLIELA